MQHLPDFSFEKYYWKKGYKIIGGVDEVGRGAFAGPVVAACVIFKRKLKDHPKIDDSKRLSPVARQIAADWIKNNAFAYGLGSVSARVINRIGIGKASKMAFRRAVKNTGRRIDFLLCDAFYVSYLAGLPKVKQKPIVHGDQKSISVAAASIIAKVYRDKLMTKLGQRRRYKKYLWGKNKGYGTEEHQKTIIKYGRSSYHRKAFVATFLSRRKH